MFHLGIDLETTGTKPGVHGIVSIGACVGEHTMHVLVHPHPGCQFEDAAMAVNGYDHELWQQHAVPLAEGLEFLTHFIAIMATLHGQGIAPAFTPLAHCVDFDRPWLEWAEEYTGHALNLGRRWACSQKAFQFLMDSGHLPEGSSSLDRLGYLAGLWPAAGRGTTHHAGDDATACYRAYQWMQRQLPRPALLSRLRRWLARFFQAPTL